MAQLTDLEQVRKARKRRKLIRAMMMLGVITAIIFAIFFIAERMGEVDYRTFFSDLQAEFASGDGFPIALPGGVLGKLTSTDKMLVLATDTNIYSYNATGKQTLGQQHGMSRMDLSVARDKVLLYDRGGTKMTLLSRASTIGTLSAPFSIYDADLATNGNFAVITGCDTYFTRVTVYNRRLKPIYRYFSDRPLVSVSISGERDAMVTGNFTTENGSFVSGIKRFQFSIDKELASTELHDELLLKLDYHHGSAIRALTDKRAILLDDELNVKNEYGYSGYRLKRYVFRPNGGLVMLLQDATGAGRNMIAVLKADFTVESTFTAPESVIAMDVDRQYLYLAMDDEIVVYNFKGEKLANMLVSNLHFIRPMEDTLYYATGNELCAQPISELLRRGTPAPSVKSSSTSSGKSGNPSRDSGGADAGKPVDSAQAGSPSPDSTASAGMTPESGATPASTPDDEPSSSADSGGGNPSRAAA